MPTSYTTADHLWTECIRLLCASKEQKIAHGFVARLENANKCFVWSKARNVDVLKACGELLFLLDFSHDGAFARTYAPETKVDEGLAVDAFGPTLRSQLSTLIETLRKDPLANYAVLSPWEGVESQQNAYFKDGNGEPNHLLNAQFLFDGKRLNLFLNFRTTDAWSLPYDLFLWGNLLSIVSGFAKMNVGFMQFQATELSLSRPMTAEESSGFTGEGWHDRTPPLKIHNAHLAKVKDPIAQLEFESCGEETMRLDFDFSECYKTATTSSPPYSSATTALSIVYLKWAIVGLESFTHQPRSERIERVREVVSILSAGADKRLLDRVATSVCAAYAPSA